MTGNFSQFGLEQKISVKFANMRYETQFVRIRESETLFERSGLFYVKNMAYFIYDCIICRSKLFIY